MKAAVLYAAGDLRLEERKRPQPGRGEVLIRVRACGVCGTDAALYRGEYPANTPVIIGHEFAGEVAEAGEGAGGFEPGDRVTVDPNVVCHACAYCRCGNEHLCERLSSMGVQKDGADAEYCVIPATNVYRIPETLSYEEAAFCEPLACAIHGVDLAGVRLGDTVLILGAGGMGNLIAQCAAAAGAATIVVSEPIALRREMALANGATHGIDPARREVERQIKDIRPLGADVVFEAAGNPGAQALCPSLVRRGGKIVWFGVGPKGKRIEVDPFLINENELSILGSFDNPFATSRAIGMLAGGRVRVGNLISHRFALEDYPRVFKIFGGADTLKLMTVMD